jgi:hypothetical protein
MQLPMTEPRSNGANRSRSTANRSVATAQGMSEPIVYVILVSQCATHALQNMLLACHSEMREPLIRVADFSDSFDGGSVNVVLAG